MSLLALPNELIAQILQHIQIDSKRKFVKLRFVCREFDDHVSRVTLQNSSLNELDIGPRLHYRTSIEWMLATKARIQHETCEQGIFAFVHDAAKHVVGRGLIPEITLDAAVVAACRLIVAVNEASWVVEHLVTWKSGHPLPQSLSSLEVYTRGQKVQNPDTFYGMLHLLVACGDGVAVESVMKELANIKAVDSVATHPVFGDLMGCAIALDQVAVIRTFLQYGLDPRIVTVEGEKIGTLVYAAEMNREAAVRAILDLSTSININARGRSSDTAPERSSDTTLGWAAREGWTDIVRSLLQRDDIDPNIANDLFETPLAAAAKEDHKDIACLLLDRVAIDPSQFGLHKNCPWRVALRSGATRIVRVFLDRFGDAIDINKVFDWNTALGVVVSTGFTPLVRMLLDVPGIEADKSYGWTPLEKAVQRENTEIVRLLLRFEVDLVCRIGDESLAHIALRHADPTIFQLLVEKALETDSNVWDQWKKLYYASEGQEWLEMRVLRSYYNIPKFRSGKRDALQQMLWISAKDGKDSAVEEILCYEEVDPNYRESDTRRVEMRHKLRRGYNYQNYQLSQQPAFRGYLCSGNFADTTTPLLVAAESGHERIFSMIYEHPRADHYVKNGLGRTCLWWAARNSSMEIVQKILACSTDGARIINVQDEEGWAPLHVAVNDTNEPITKLLLERPEIDVNVTTKQGWTALHMAMVSCSRNLANLLLDHPGIDTSLRIDDGRTAFDLHEGCECAISSDISQRIGT
ncbi:unnamed protein product [Clonostachys byssicola]|uniref:F-box domain-containing protein n=1 Tax=Clonostachys byssicola TaxID=160290 RepID=A0A9N9UQ83_9HYPO|nr:unnamed protein product [Clonostachys byssicola]